MDRPPGHYLECLEDREITAGKADEALLAGLPCLKEHCLGSLLRVVPTLTILVSALSRRLPREAVPPGSP
jgi:hypothetical protein